MLIVIVQVLQKAYILSCGLINLKTNLKRKGKLPIVTVTQMLQYRVCRFNHCKQ